MEEHRTELPEAEDIAAPPDWMMKKIMRLSPEQQKMMRLLLGLEDGRRRTMQEVADEFGVTRERVRMVWDRVRTRPCCFAHYWERCMRQLDE